MRMLTLFWLAAAPAEPADGLIAGAEGFDLAKATPQRPCNDGTGNAIVVCGRRAKAEEIVVLNPGQFESGPLRGETGIGSGARLDMHAEQHSRPDGRSGPAAMLRVRIPF